MIGVGVKQSTSDLLVANCDEFIFYDDLVRESQRSAARRDPKTPQSIARRSPEELETRKSEAIELALETFDALVAERGEHGKIWASMLKEAIKRRKPDFNETYYGFRSFGTLLEEAQSRGLLELGRDEKSGAFVNRSSGQAPRHDATVPVDASAAVPATAVAGAPAKRRGRGRGKSTAGGEAAAPVRQAGGAVQSRGRDENANVVVPRDNAPEPRSEQSFPVEAPVAVPPPERRGRARGKRASEKSGVATPVREHDATAQAVPQATVVVDAPPADTVAEAGAAKAGKLPARSRRPRKPKASPETVTG